MRYLVNGFAAEKVESADTTVSQVGDTLVVHEPEGSFTAVVVRQGEKTLVSYRGHVYEVERESRRGAAGAGAGSGEVRAPMPGQIVQLICNEGDEVQVGDKLLVLEAMKMQQPMLAAIAGTVSSISVAVGDQVTDGQILAVITPHE